MNRLSQRLWRLTISAMFIAMSVVISIFCKSLLNFAGGLLRITFENLPIILSGIALGPATGAVVGLSADLVGYMLSGQAYPLDPMVTLASALVGIISGVVSRYIIKKRGSLQVIVSGASAHILCSMLLKSVALYKIYGWAVLVRIPIYSVVGALEIMLLCLLFKQQGFSKLIEEIDTNDKRTK